MSGCGDPPCIIAELSAVVSAAEAIYTDIVEGNRAIPRWLAIRLIKARQLGGFVKSDGVSRQTWAHTEQTYFIALTACRQFLSAAPLCWARHPALPITA